MNTRNYLLFVVISILVIAAAVLLPERVLGASTVTGMSDLSSFQQGCTVPQTVVFAGNNYESIGVWPGATITSVILGNQSAAGINIDLRSRGVVFGANATDVGFPPPAGSADNNMAIERGLLVSDYGPLSSTLTVSFVTINSLGTMTSGGTTKVALQPITNGTTRAHLLDSSGRIIETVPLTSSPFTSITSSTPFYFIVLEFTQPAGSGLASIAFEGNGLGLSAAPAPVFTTPTPTNPNSGSSTCNCSTDGQNGSGTNGSTTNGNGTQGQILGASTIAPGIVVGSQAGTPPEVRVYAPDGTLKVAFNAYEEHFMGGVQVGMGDLEGDGRTEIITAPGPGSTSQIRFFDLTGKFITGFYAYDIGFRGGVNIAVADIEGDGKAEIVTAPKRGGGPNVRVFGLRNGGIVPTTENFFAYDLAFHGGVNVALGDVDGDGQKDIITAPESGGGPHLRLFSFKVGVYRPSILGLMAYDPNFRGGVNVAAGDLDGDGYAEVVTAPQKGGGPHIRIFSYTANRDLGLRSPGFMAYDSGFAGGANVAVIDFDSDGTSEIVTTPESSATSLVRFFNGSGQRTRSEFLAFPATRLDGANIAQGYLE